MKKKRIAYIDFLKGFAIILVILGHCIQFTDTNYSNNYVFSYIYSFHMPLFMFLSGFVSFKPILEYKTIKKRAIELLIPFFSWPILGQLIDGKRIDISVYKGIIINPGGWLWFLWTLFFISLFFFFFDVISRKIHVRQEWVVLIGDIILLIIGHYLPNGKDFGAVGIARYLIFYAIGFYLKKYEENFASGIMRYSSLIVLLFVISAYYWNINSAPSFLSENFQIPMVGKLYRLIVGIIGIIAAYGIAKKYVGNQNSTLLVKIVNKIGRETLGLYCIQFHTIYWAMYFLNMNNLSVRIICVFVSSFVLSIFLDYLLNKNRVLAFLFLGKNRIIKIK